MGALMTDSDDLHSLVSEHNEVIRIERLTHHIQRIREDQHAMRAAIERMSEAVTRLALVEERQASASSAIDRLAHTLEKLDERLRRLEVADPMHTKAAEWVQSAVWAAAAAAVMFVAAKSGLF
jgi:chromosome segregation ATPase